VVDVFRVRRIPFIVVIGSHEFLDFDAVADGVVQRGDESLVLVRREPALRDERVFGCRELQRRFGLLDLDGQFLLDAQEECGFLSLDLVELRVDLVDT